MICKKCQPKSDRDDKICRHTLFGASLVAQWNESIQVIWVWSLGGDDPLEKEMETHSKVFLHGKSQRQEPGELTDNGIKKHWARLSTFTHLILLCQRIKVKYVPKKERNGKYERDKWYILKNENIISSNLIIHWMGLSAKRHLRRKYQLI